MMYVFLETWWGFCAELVSETILWRCYRPSSRSRDASQCSQKHNLIFKETCKKTSGGIQRKHKVVSKLCVGAGGGSAGRAVVRPSGRRAGRGARFVRLKARRDGAANTLPNSRTAVGRVTRWRNDRSRSLFPPQYTHTFSLKIRAIAKKKVNPAGHSVTPQCLVIVVYIDSIFYRYHFR